MSKGHKVIMVTFLLVFSALWTTIIIMEKDNERDIEDTMITTESLEEEASLEEYRFNDMIIKNERDAKEEKENNDASIVIDDTYSNWRDTSNLQHMIESMINVPVRVICMEYDYKIEDIDTSITMLFDYNQYNCLYISDEGLTVYYMDIEKPPIYIGLTLDSKERLYGEIGLKRGISYSEIEKCMNEHGYTLKDSGFIIPNHIYLFSDDCLDYWLVSDHEDGRDCILYISKINETEDILFNSESDDVSVAEIVNKSRDLLGCSQKEIQEIYKVDFIDDLGTLRIDSNVAMYHPLYIYKEGLIAYYTVVDEEYLPNYIGFYAGVEDIVYKENGINKGMNFNEIKSILENDGFVSIPNDNYTGGITYKCVLEKEGVFYTFISYNPEGEGSRLFLSKYDNR